MPRLNARPHFMLVMANGAKHRRHLETVEVFLSQEVAEAAERMLVASTNFTRVYSA